MSADGRKCRQQLHVDYPQQILVRLQNGAQRGVAGWSDLDGAFRQRGGRGGHGDMVYE